MHTRHLSYVTAILATLIAFSTASAALIDARGQVWSVNAVGPASHYFAVGRASDGSTANTWVTEAGLPDYFASYPAGQPVLVMDLGANVTMNGAAFWNYSTDNANNTSAFKLRFATAAEGPMGFARSIAYQPTFAPAYGGPGTQENLAFSQQVTARYVELTANDNYRGLPPNAPGGDRVGFADIRFDVASLPSQQATVTRLRPTATQTDGGSNPSVLYDGSAGTQWYTVGNGTDYFAAGTAPVVVIDLGEERTIDRFNFRNYSIPGNAVKDFSLRFATEADGPAGFGTSIAFNPAFSVTNAGPATLQQQALGATLKARYVQMTITDNHYGNGGGGDRVGFSEIDFVAGVPRPQEAFIVRPVSVTSSTAGSDFYPAANLIDGNTGTTWVSGAEGAYYTNRHAPVLTFDLGSDRGLAGFQFTNYNVPGNALKDFALVFATAADGPNGFGTTIAYSPVYHVFPDGGLNQEFIFDEMVNARYVRMLTLDNYAGWGLAGGDRVGFAEINFLAVPEPLSLGLLGLALPGLATYIRRRSRR